MPNDFTPYLPTLIAREAIALLKNRSGFLGRVRVETRQESSLEGLNSVVIPKDAASFTPTNVSYSSAASAQAITIPSATLAFSYHQEIKISANELESRTAQGGLTRILERTVPGMVNGLISAVDASLGALYTSATSQVGAAGAPVTDATVREACTALMDYKVPMNVPGHCNLILSPRGYMTDLMAEDRYVLANQSGTDQALRGGTIPSVYNIGVDYTHNYTSASGYHGMLFAQDAMTIGFVQFDPANNGQVIEEILTDPETGITLRVQKYYDPSLRTAFYQVDVKWGVAVTDANRMVDVLH